MRFAPISSVNALVLFSIVAVSATVGCSPKINIRHMDPTHDQVIIRIDGENEGSLEFDDSESIRVRRGRHTVEITPSGETICPWTEDGKGWELWVDGDMILSLLPPPEKTQRDLTLDDNPYGNGSPKPLTGEAGESP